PFLKGTHASTAFCLLYKLWTLKLTVKQIEGLVDNADSPHIRAMGFIYLRYVCDPHELWAWFGDYLEDDEEVQIESGIRPRVVTIGKVVRDLIMESKWLGTILPRIPVSIARELEGKVKEVLGEGGKKSGPVASGPVGGSYGQGRGRGDDDNKRGDWAAGRGRGVDAGDDRRRGDGDRRRIDEDRRRDVDRRRGYDDEADLDYGDDNRRRRSRSPPARRYHDDGRYGRGDRGSGRDYEQSYGRGGYGGDRDAFSGRSREPQDARGGRSDYRSRSPPMRRSDDGKSK
ncbi:PRP38 pre-mRNA processing factor 38 domain-containing protein B, partial [Chytriomyces hyalinus]